MGGFKVIILKKYNHQRKKNGGLFNLVIKTQYLQTKEGQKSFRGKNWEMTEKKTKYIKKLLSKKMFICQSTKIVLRMKETAYRSS